MANSDGEDRQQQGGADQQAEAVLTEHAGQRLQKRAHRFLRGFCSCSASSSRKRSSSPLLGRFSAKALATRASSAPSKTPSSKPDSRFSLVSARGSSAR